VVVADEAMNKDKEACVVFKEVGIEFGSSRVTMRSKQEMDRIECD
jgi:hypothetical protein